MGVNDAKAAAGTAIGQRPPAPQAVLTHPPRQLSLGLLGCWLLGVGADTEGKAFFPLPFYLIIRRKKFKSILHQRLIQFTFLTISVDPIYFLTKFVLFLISIGTRFFFHCTAHACTVFYHLTKFKIKTQLIISGEIRITNLVRG